MLKSSQVWTGLFVTEDATGALATPGTGPAGTLYLNGVSNAATVTISGSNPYKWSVTLPTLAAGDSCSIYITATISSIATASVVAEDIGNTDLPLIPTTAGRTLDVSAGGEAGLDWANIGSPTTTVVMSGTTIGVLTTYTGNTVQTGDSYARIGATGSGLTSLMASYTQPTGFLAADFTRLDAAITSRMATYTQPSGFLAATFPTTIASTTNITAATGVDITKILGTAIPTPTVAGVPNVNVQTWNDLITVALPLVPTTAGRTLDVSAGGEAGLDWANIGSKTSTNNLTNTTIATVTNQLTAAQVATGVWQDAVAGDFTVTNSAGKSIWTGAVPGTATGLFVAGSNAATTVNITGTWTGNIVGTLSTLTTYTGDTPQTGDSFARIGAAGVGLTSVALVATGLNAITATDPGGVATTFPQMLVQVWRRFFKRVTRSSTQIKTYADDATTVRTTQTYTSSGSDDDVGAAS